MDEAPANSANDLQPWRRSLRKRLFVAVASAGAWVLLRVIAATMRARHLPYDVSDELRARYGAYVFAMFHGSHMPLFGAFRDHDITVITSHSADGEILTRLLQWFGFHTVRGSSSRGGMRAVVQLSRQVKKGRDVAVAVDGPRGPRQQVKAGVLLLAKISGAPIIPVAVAMSRYKQFKSWDRFQFTLPFSRALIVTDGPLIVPPDADDDQLEQLRRELETRMVALQNEADEAVMTEAGTRAMLEKYAKKD